jgi:hypothetical protein
VLESRWSDLNVAATGFSTVVGRAYADWSFFDEDRRMLRRSHVELIEIPQRMGASRKNAAGRLILVDVRQLPDSHLRPRYTVSSP